MLGLGWGKTMTATIKTIKALWANFEENGRDVSLAVLSDAYRDAGLENLADACQRILHEGWEPHDHILVNRIFDWWDYYKGIRRYPENSIVGPVIYKQLATDQFGIPGRYQYLTDAYRDLIRVLVQQSHE